MKIRIVFGEDSGTIEADGQVIHTMNRDDDPGITAVEVVKAMAQFIPGEVEIVEDEE